MLRKEDDHFIAGNLDAHIATDSRICDYDANKWTHHQMQIQGW